MRAVNLERFFPVCWAFGAAGGFVLFSVYMGSWPCLSAVEDWNTRWELSIFYKTFPG